MEESKRILYVFVLNYFGEWRTVPVKTKGTITEAYDLESGVSREQVAHLQKLLLE